ncbi:ATP-binding protein [Vagococcus xieshaowenii]|uniref:ATP-binding protein n=1 Tax=Vagococcus xieshaowenii TaxID=2562451 RepID=A0AAJ5EES4_9ENTE|nr:ATP-binding protein [Vagococcus xieshaowenii]QCA28230.1 ATP-binding protein [Vagococcus xieshaowenii]TFZ41885.1 ATP-binding protein [Vagococcus xieshaowenii]
MNITKGIIAKAQKVVIYGPEGIGKTTLASQFPNPVFCDTEGSTRNIDVFRADKPSSWQMLMNQIEEVKHENFQTYVIDSVDWAESLCVEYLCQKEGKTSIEDFGYGSGYIKLGEEIGRFLNKLTDLTEMGINVVLTAHAQIKRFERPDEMGAYDRYELKLGNKKTQSTTAPLVKEWADMVLFCNYQVTVISTDNKNKKKAVGGQRKMYTTHNPAWDAKNRFGLPDEVDMSYESIRFIFDNLPPRMNEVIQQAVPQPQAPVQQVSPVQEKMQQLVQQEIPNLEPERTVEIPPIIPASVADLMKLNNVTSDEIMAIIHQGGFMPNDTPIENVPTELWGYLSTNWDKALNLLNTQIRNF